MSTSHKILKFTRQLHLYLGVFTAPALLFFALTGGLQVFSLHETTRGSDYKPPAWLVTMAQLHKKQTTVVPVHKPRPTDADNHAPPAAAPVPAKLDTPRADAKHPLPLKIFAALAAFALLISTLTGVYMAYRYTRRPRLVSFLLLAGVLVPVVLALI